jgi:hypothetical protein
LAGQIGLVLLCCKSGSARRTAPTFFLCWLACAVDLALKQLKPSALLRDIVQKHQALSFAFIPAVVAGETE